MREGSGTCWCGAPVYVPGRGEDRRLLLAVPAGRPTREEHEPATCPVQDDAFLREDLPVDEEVEEAVRAYRRRRRRRR